MYRKLCVLTLIALCAGLVDTFSWDIVVSRDNRLEFYNKGTLKHSESYPTSDMSVAWMTYDPSHNRVLFSNKSNDGNCIYNFDIATRKTQPLIKSESCRDINPESYIYDPATELLFGCITNSSSVYSFVVKSGSNNKVGKLVMDSIYIVDDAQPIEFAVESCGGYIYWTTNSEKNRIERARFYGTHREIIIDDGKMYRHALTIDSRTQKMYFCENEFYHILSADFYLISADLDGKNRKTIYSEMVYSPLNPPYQLTVSNDCIYWTIDKISIFQLPKNLPYETNVIPKQFLIDTTQRDLHYIAANYKIEEQTPGISLCKALKSVPSTYSATSGSLSLSTKVNLVNETKVSLKESRVIERGDVSVCQYYCFHGDCSTSAEGQPKCRCDAGYSGLRCEVDACQTFCLNDGICSLNEMSVPVCRCTQGYQGDRCEINIFEAKSFQHLFTKIAMWNEILNKVTEGKGVKSTCASNNSIIFFNSYNIFFSFIFFYFLV